MKGQKGEEGGGRVSEREGEGKSRIKTEGGGEENGVEFDKTLLPSFLYRQRRERFGTFETLTHTHF